MKEARFAQYRAYSAGRVTANNSMIALLAGSRLAAHTLQLHQGSPHQLPGLYPKVLDIDRFNLLPDAARDLLNNADAELAAVAIPYALAVYEAFVKDVIDMTRAAGFVVPGGYKPVQAGAMHKTLFSAINRPQPIDEVALFHLLRTMRNSQIHHAGHANEELTETLAQLTSGQLELWARLAMSSTDTIVEQGTIHFTIGHLVASFAITKSLARGINAAVVDALPREYWADIAVSDFISVATEPHNSVRWKRKLEGFTRFNYEPLVLGPVELERAARKSGVWTAPTW